MKKKALWKDIFREIWRTKARFLSILAIISLGVCFFAGIKATGPDMLTTADRYFVEHQLMDLKVQSTHGLTMEHIAALKNVPGVKEIEAGYTADTFIDEKGLIAKVFSYNNTHRLNQYQITSGRLPERSGEIAIDDKANMIASYHLGDTITFTSKDAAMDLTTSFKTLRYQVVGTVKSPQFIENHSRSSSSIGKGTSDAFVVILEEDFNLPVYTEAYLSFTDTVDEKAYTDAYDQLIENHRVTVEQAMMDQWKENAAAIKPEGKQKVAEVPTPKFFVFDRSINPGYNEFSDNAARLASIATAFPVFFFLIAALVSLTTMTRMVEEQRLQIGTLKALGYSNWDIILKFIVYGSLASITAAALGLGIGFTLFPTIIYNAYGALYNLPPIRTDFYFSYSAISIAVALLCTTMTAIIATRVELRSNASVLMRPKSPKSGQRILLERIPFFWKRLSFVQKVTARNLFRYKQRMFMTVFGVAGCTALILTGFGLKDSIGDIAGIQFSEIMKYNALIAFHEERSEQLKVDYDQLIADTTNITGTLNVAQDAVIANEKAVNDQEVTLFVPETTSGFDQFVVLKDRRTGAKKPLSDQGAIITEKLAKLYGLHAGSTLTVKNNDNERFEIKVAGITENYARHYIYMTPMYYETTFNKTPAYNTQLLTTNDVSQEWEDAFGEKLTQNERVAIVSFTSGVGHAFDETMDSMNIVVIVLIVSAAALAFVVLYNLTNINVSERIRELSTIKVLGFYDKEVTLYIYRENIILSLLGIIAGSFLGIILHRFVLITSEVDAMMFSPIIKWLSFVYAASLTLLFASIVMLTMHAKLKRIDMIEALKSVE
ncbi:MAG: ABC transporter permease [Gorillibacterium sp.]|nr:ABC transporter permease [Gorillibacterium sp.]